MKLTHSKDSCTLVCSRTELSAFASVVYKDPAAVNIRGILIDAKERVVVSTDGHRMLVADIGTHDHVAGQEPTSDQVTHHRVVLPPDLFRAALKTAASSDQISITWCPGATPRPKISIQIGFISMSGEGEVVKFPPWRAAIQSEKPSVAVPVNPNYIADGCILLREVLGRFRHIEIWLGQSAEDGTGSVTILQAFGHEEKGSRWRYCVMPMRTGEIPREPWEDKETPSRRASPGVAAGTAERRRTAEEGSAAEEARHEEEGARAHAEEVEEEDREEAMTTSKLVITRVYQTAENYLGVDFVNHGAATELTARAVRDHTIDTEADHGAFRVTILVRSTGEILHDERHIFRLPLIVGEPTVRANWLN